MKCRTCGNDLQGNEYNCPFCGSCVDYTQAVEQAKAGREEGFTFLYENTYRNKLYIAMKYMKNEQDAMDVLQDAYIKAFARLDSLQDANAFPGWMSTIVANTAINALQKKKAVLFSDLQNENDEGDVFEYTLEDENMSTQPEMACTVQETQDMVRELINSLSDEQRICVLMFHLEGYSIKDIATVLNCSENTVKSRLNYGRKNIKAKAEELQKKGYKLYSYTPMCLLVYLLMAERGNMIVTHVFEQMAGLGGNIAAGIIHGGAMQMAGNVTGGAAQAGAAGQAAGGITQAGTAGSAAGAVETGKTVAATVGKQAFIKTMTGKIAIAAASIAIVGGVAGGQLDGVALDPTGGVQVGACAQVGEVALLIERNRRVLGQGAYQLGLIRLTLSLAEGNRLGAGQFKALKAYVLLDDVVHFLFELRQSF